MKYKVLASVAHNFGHSFASLLNYEADDYVMSHLARRAVATGADELRVDLLSGAAEPADLLVPPVRASLATRLPWLPRLLRSQRIDPAAVVRATLRLRFDLARRRADHRAPDAWELPFECLVELTDDRGRVHAGRVDDWWLVHDSRPPIVLSWWQRLWWRLKRAAA